MPAATKILVLTPVYPPSRGGIQAVAAGLVRNWPNVEACVVTVGHSSTGYSRHQDDHNVIRIGSSLGRQHLTIARLNLRALASAVVFRPDVVLCLHVVTAPAALVLERLRIPFVLYIHGTEARRKPRLTSAAVKRARRVIGGSRYALELATAQGAESTKTRWIEPGVDPAPAREVQRDSTPTIVTVSRLDDRHKGHDVMIDAMVLINKRLPEARWIVVGDGGLRKDLERYSSERGIAHKITFVGAVRDDERERWLDRAHVFAMPSRIESDGEVEGYGLVYLEAGAHSLPVVAGNVAGARDAVQQGKTGLLVEPTDPVAVADAISKLLDDGELREQLGKEGRSKADRQTWALFAERVEQTLHEAISETRR